MTILIAPDKFKGSLNAQAVCDSIERGIQHAHPTANIIKIPIADGGDGTLSILQQYIEAEKVYVNSMNALGKPMKAYYLLHQKVAYVELAIASGLAHLKTAERNPLYTHNRGTGILIKDALERGAQKIVLCLGGSATTEAGLSIASELGYRFLNQQNQAIQPTGETLLAIAHYEKTKAFINFELAILCDVTNPLYGPQGAAYVYGPQKGANQTSVELLDMGLQHIAQLIQQQTTIDIHAIPGGGAAGGIAGGLFALFDAQLLNGFDYLAKLSNLESQLEASDLVVSGEGKIDASSLQGKVPGKIAELCLKHQKPLILIAGDSSLRDDALHQIPLYTVSALAEHDIDSMRNAATYVERIARGIDWEAHCESLK